jgi:spermidine synthase
MAHFADIQEGAHTSETPHRSVPLALWAGIIFLSAFLLFQVQPILAKIILPWFGGAAGVWITCLMFFQVTYLLGNLYAHWLVQRASPFVSRVHVALLAASLFLLPVIPKAFWKPVGSNDPAGWILGLLVATVGLPFFLLSATSPLLQTWYSRARQGAQPYRFYALSNAGSLLALLSYPIAIEPFISTRHQAVGWSAAYAVFVVLCALVAFRRATDMSPRLKSAEGPARPDWKLQLLWMALAADASAFLLAITSHISQNVAAVPLLWVLPLSLYLLSLVLCFEGRNWYRRFLFLRLLAVALGGMAYALSPDFANAGPMLLVPLFCASLFICCMVCHGELEKLKPPPEHLTRFYLMVALGGALGGIFVGVIAPHLFRGFYELPVAIAGCAILLPFVLQRDQSTSLYKAGLRPASLIAAGLIGLLVVSLFVVARRQAGHARVMVRNFYGGLRVTDFAGSEKEPARRELVNGTIVHGIEILAAGRHSQPTTYYGPESGAGLALLAARKRGSVRAGIIGLGAGTLASYGQKGDHYTFYEINPLVIQLAHTQFDFLRDSPASIGLLPGDARLSFEGQSPRGFDVLVVDAFSGDAIPVHLLTREAFELYFRHLSATGILAVHVSNKYLDLKPVVTAAAEALGKEAIVVTNGADPKNEIYVSTWMLLGNRPEELSPANFPVLTMVLEKKKKLRLWTDDYSNLLQILK